MPKPARDSDAHARFYRRLFAQRKLRDSEGLFVLEGTRSVVSAIEAGFEFHSAIRSPVLFHSSSARKQISNLQREFGLRVTNVSPEKFREISHLPRASGIAAIVRQNVKSLVKPLFSARGFHLAMTRIRSDGNLGTLLRTAIAAGCSGLILIGDDIDPYAPSVVRASMGSLFRLPIVRTSWKSLHQLRKRTSMHIVGASPEAETCYSAATYLSPTVLMLGEERRGLSSRQREACDQFVRIPMEPESDSLNVSVAGSLLMYELRRAATMTGPSKG